MNNKAFVVYAYVVNTSTRMVKKSQNIEIVLKRLWATIHCLEVPLVFGVFARNLLDTTNTPDTKRQGPLTFSILGNSQEVAMLYLHVHKRRWPNLGLDFGEVKKRSKKNRWTCLIYRSKCSRGKPSKHGFSFESHSFSWGRSLFDLSRNILYYSL